jgi:hypothetical protein
MSAFGTSFGLLNAALFAGFLSRVVPGVNNAIDDAAQEIIDLALNEIQSRLYPGHGYLTGALHDSYHGEYTKSGTSVVNINISTDLYYAPIVEFSWGGRISHFFPAMQVVEPQIPEIIKKHINGALGIG